VAELAPPEDSSAVVHAAVVGAGPAGFFTAAALLGLKDASVVVDMYDRLPTPWGLVRSGVAPDHPKIKSVSAIFDKTAAHERFRFFGGIEVGRDITGDELTERYDVVVYATGAQIDRGLGIPGEQLSGVVPASAFVGWYNGHPDFADLELDLSVDTALVVGNGNVALDIARILLTPAPSLAATDIADHALAALRATDIRTVVIVGRRGPADATWTTPELEELADMTGAAVSVEPAGILSSAPTSGDARVARNLEVLGRYAASPTPAVPGARRAILRFAASPVELLDDPDAGASGVVERVVLASNDLVVDPAGRMAAVDSGARESLRAGLVITATGYATTPVDGLPVAGGLVAHRESRIEGRPREYVVGWAKRGPSGVIGMNKKCAAETVASIREDLPGLLTGTRGVHVGEVTEEWLRSRQPDLVTGEDWALIDATERGAGEASGRPRVKLVSYASLGAARGARS
jgi:ferredoxin--NADP+ reductase